jgi:hypothetical protein
MRQNLSNSFMNPYVVLWCAMMKAPKTEKHESAATIETCEAKVIFSVCESFPAFSQTRTECGEYGQ